MRRTIITVSDKQRSEKIISKQKFDLTTFKRWKKRVKKKLRKSREKKRNSKCLLWKDLILPGNINLGQICTKIDHSIPFEKADTFCKVNIPF